MGGGGGGWGAVGLAIAVSYLAAGPARAECPRPTSGAPGGAGPSSSPTSALPGQSPQVAGVPLAEEVEDAALAAQAERLGITAAIENGRGRLLPRQARKMAAALVREAQRNGLDPRLVAAVAEVESNFDPFAVSSQGAVGLMQVMPATARWLGGAGRKALRDRELFDYELNLVLGTDYLAQLLKQFSSVEAALLAYNTGPTGARKLLASGTKPGRAAYPRRVLDAYRRLASADPQTSQATSPSCPDGSGG